jgi:hypothetical protein
LEELENLQQGLVWPLLVSRLEEWKQRDYRLAARAKDILELGRLQGSASCCEAATGLLGDLKREVSNEQHGE